MRSLPQFASDNQSLHIAEHTPWAAAAGGQSIDEVSEMPKLVSPCTCNHNHLRHAVFAGSRKGPTIWSYRLDEKTYHQRDPNTHDRDSKRLLVDTMKRPRAKQAPDNGASAQMPM